MKASEITKNKEANWTLLKELWEQGVPRSEIRKRLGWSDSALTVQTHRARQAGWDIPRGRREMPKRNHGRQVR